MRRACLAGVMVCLAFTWAAPAVAGDRGRTVTARFVKLIERQIGEREYLGVVVRDREGDDQATVYVSRKQKELVAAARRLRENQAVTLRYVREDGVLWLTRLEAGEGDAGEKRREGDGDRVSVEAFHFGGNRLTVVEALKKVE